MMIKTFILPFVHMTVNLKKFSGVPGYAMILVGDMMGITFDSYHDYRTGFEFTVTAWGQKVDLVLFNPDELGLQLECGMERQNRIGGFCMGC